MLNNDYATVNPLDLNTDRYLDGHLASSSFGYIFKSDFPVQELTPDKKRSLSHYLLRKNNLDPEHFEKLDQWYISSLARKLADDLNLQDNVFSLKRENFLSCNSDLTYAHLLHFKDGSKGVRIYRCGNKYCFTCRDKKRAKIAQKIKDVLIELYDRKVINRVWRFVITFEDTVAQKAVKDKELANSLFNGVHKAIRKIFNLNNKSNLAIIVFPHIIGDSDVFKDRFHLHVWVVPCLYDRKTGQFNNVDVTDKININKFKMFLREYCNCHVINPQVNYYYIKYKRSGKYVINGKMLHSLKYDARGFGHTFLKSIISFNIWDKGQALLNFYYYKEGFKCLGLRYVTLNELSKRWIEIVNNSYKIRMWGWFNDYEKLFPEVLEPSYKMQDIEKVEKVTLYRTFERKYNKEIGKVVWDIKEEIQYQGRYLEINKDIKEVYIEDWDPGRYSFLF